MNADRTLQIAIIGGGAAGFFSAISAARNAEQANLNVQIRIFESTGMPLKKVKISGGGRCNVTHNCFDTKRFSQNYPRGQRELLSPLQRFQAEDTVEWFKKEGIYLVAEPDGRMFPKTHRSETIVSCYLDLAKKLGIELLTHHRVSRLETKEDGQWELEVADKGTFDADAVMFATGSVPGSYKLAESVGHKISERAPSLFSFKISDPLLEGLSGLSFPQAAAKLSPEGGKSFKQHGPTLITHWGLSGPAILKLSAWAAREMKRANYKARLMINWSGDPTRETVQEKISDLKESHSKSEIKNTPYPGFPKRFWIKLLEVTGIPSHQLWSEISKKNTNSLIEKIFSSQLTIDGQNRFKEEFVECGGVTLKEIDFKTMQSKIHDGLYFGGEVLDIDGITGGFNFQNAWTTGWIAAQSMIERLKLLS